MEVGLTIWMLLLALTGLVAAVLLFIVLPKRLSKRREDRSASK